MAHASGMIASNRSNRRLQKHRSSVYAEKKEQMNLYQYGDYVYHGQPIEVKKTTVDTLMDRRQSRETRAIVLTILTGLFIAGLTHYYYFELF